jgi:transcriptional regulator PpsR
VTESITTASRFHSLQPETVARLVSATADVALVVDTGGVVRHVEFGGDGGLANLLEGRLIGRAWLDTVTAESRDKANDLLLEAAANDDARPREINHTAPTEKDSLPIRYSALKLSGSNEIIVMGRDLRSLAALEQRLSSTQQALERDYNRLRASETRYRLLFQLTGEAAVIADAGTRRIVECNPAAQSLFGDRPRLVGRAVQQLFDPGSQDALLSIFAQAAASAEGARGICRLADGRDGVAVAATLFRQNGSSFLLVRASPSESRPHITDDAPLFAAAIEHMPDAMIIADGQGRIAAANPAFLELAQLGTIQQVKGQPLDRWLGRPGIDDAALRSALTGGDPVRDLRSVMRGSFGGFAEIDVSAASFELGERMHALVIRQRAAGTDLETRLKDDLPKSVQQMAELVGSVPMKDLVRQTTDIIERLCIEAALQITGDNRASAADLLGLSRQSLYAKLHRYGLSVGETENEPA